MADNNINPVSAKSSILSNMVGSDDNNMQMRNPNTNGRQMKKNKKDK